MIIACEYELQQQQEGRKEQIRSEANCGEHYLPDVNMLTPKMLVPLGSLQGLEALQRSRRLVGTISTNYKIHASGDLVMIKRTNLKI